jgi:ATP-dependent DNA helicase RecQ
VDLPTSIAGYYQAPGRAGRDGEPATAWMAYGLADVVQQRRFIAESTADPAYQQASQARLNAMLALCETAECRRVNMLAYFGEHTGACGNCDTCLNPPATWDGTTAAQKLLSTVVRLDRERRQRYGAGHLIDILRAKRTPRVAQHAHDQLSTWGVGADLSDAEWRAVARQLLTRGDLAVDAGGHGVLVATPRSWEILRGEREVPLRRAVIAGRARTGRTGSARGLGGGGPARKGTGSVGEPAALTPEEQALFEGLRAWRSEVAKERSVPAYVVFHDSTLRALATARPRTRDELKGISGIGQAKLDAYAAGVLAVIGAASGAESNAIGPDSAAASKDER